MIRELFILSLTLNAIETLQQIQCIEKNVNSEVLKCAKAIGQRYFDQPQNVEIISREPIYDFEDFAIVMKSTAASPYPDFRRSLTKYAVIFLESIDYEDDLKLLSILTRSDPQGRFIVSIKSEIGPLNTRNEYSKRIILYLASIERWNVVILTNDARNRTIWVNTYTTFSASTCGSVLEIVNHGDCEDAVALDDLFPIHVNFYKCPIRLSATVFPPFSFIREKNGEKQIYGIESDLVKLIVAKLNATYELFQVTNGTSIRAMVKSRKVDLAWSCLLQFKETETTWSQSYLFNKVLIVVPQSRLMPAWMNLILPFETEVWVALGAFIVVILLMKLLIPSIGNHFHLEWMLLGFFGIGIAKLPTRLSHRIYLVSWMLVGYIIMQSYSAGLTGFFASPGQYKQMQTLNELDKSKIVIGGLQNIKGQLAETNPRLSRDLKVGKTLETKPVSEVFSGTDEYFENLAKLYAGASDGIATYVRGDEVPNVTRGRESEFIVIPEHVNSFPLALLLPNSSSILEVCNRVIYNVCEAGLIQLWNQWYIREMDGGSRSRDVNSSQKTSLKYFGAVFCVLFVGYCLSCIIFAGELIFAKFRT